MATTEKYTTVIELNSEQAKRNLDELRKKVESWKSDLAEAKEKKMGRSFIAAIRKELSEAEKELKKYDSEVARTIDTLNDLQSASVDRIEEAQKSLLRLSKEVPHDSPFYEQLNGMLDQVTQELENIKATKAFEHLQQEAEGATKTFAQTRAEAEFVRQTVENIDTASLKQLKLAEQTAKGIKESAGQGTLEYNGAATSLDKIREKLSEIDAQERKVVTTAAQYNQAMKAIHKDEKVVADEMELIDRTLKNLSTASIRDLEFSIKALKEQIQDTERTGDSVEQLTEKLKLLNAELKKVQDMQKPDEKKENFFARSMNFLNKNWGAITQTLAAYSGLRDIVKGSVEAFAEMDQEMNNVRKYTGQTIGEVERMNETFKQIDTRTPREELNQLAGSAGRLGITSTEKVLEFVDAADKINVALGDDLGKGAVDSIGKLAMAFGEDDKKGLRQAMLATGSAVNELAQNSAAGAGYLVDFAARLSGIGIQAGMTQAQILGLGAAMDENMQKDEMAATALSQIITKMTTDSEIFARIAGKNVEEFAQLVKTDMNQALMQFFETMNKKGGFTELAPLFEQMGLDGTRAIGVLSTLSSKIDDVRRHQELATAAYEKGTSVIDEFNVQNKTYQAQLEKIRKAFNDLRIELGEKLLPVASATISTTSMIVKVLNTIINFAGSYTKTLTTLTAAVITLTIAENKRLIVMRYTAFVNNVLIKGTKQLFDLLNRHPYVLVATAIATVVALMADLASKNKLVSVETAALNRIRKDAASRMGEEQAKLDILIQTARSEFSSLENRKKAIEELNRIIPGYNGLLDETTGKYRENKKALDDYLGSLARKYEIEGAKEMLAEIGKEVAEASVAIADAQRQLPDALAEDAELSMNTGGVYGKTRTDELRSQLEENNKVLEDAGKKRKAIYDAYPELLGVDDQKPTFTIYLPPTDPSYQQQDNTQNNDTKKFWEQQLKERREKLKGLREDANATSAAIEDAAKKVKEAEDKLEIFTNAKAGAKQKSAEDKDRQERERKANDAAKAETERQLAELTHRYAMGRILYCDYVDEQERIQLEGIERRMLIYNTESLEYQKLSRQRNELLLNGSEESQKLSLAQMKQSHEERLSAIEQLAWRENMTEQQKNDMIFREDMRFLDEQRILYRKGTLERINLENEISERDRKYKLEREKEYLQLLQQVRKDTGKMNYEALEKIEIAGAKIFFQALIEQGKITQEEYDAIIEHIRKKFAQLKAEMAANSDISGKAAESLDTAKKNAGVKEVSTGDNAVTGIAGIFQAVENQKLVNEQLKLLYGEDYENNREYQEAKRQLDDETMRNIVAGAQAAYSSISSFMSAASSYAQACSDLELAKINANYDKQIKAAGNNTKKKEKLEKERDEKIRKAKTEANKKAMAMEMAQAVAQTAMGALNAYVSTWRGAGYPASLVLAPISAGIALAAGALQIATIKKQHQAQEAGYYEGGFTGGRRYRKEAGVVHEGEFVANHQAVNNQQLLPIFNLLDQAQRNNRVGTLRAEDVTNVMGGPAAQVVTPIVNVQAPDNEELIDTLATVRETQDRLATQLEQGIGVDIPIDGENGIYRKMKRYEDLLNHK